MSRTAAERFIEKQDRSGGPMACWPWRGTRSPQGYGQFWTGERVVRAHRFAWELSSGQQIPDGLVAAHLCNRKICTNPRHIQPMISWENTHDAIRDELCPRVAQGFGHIAKRCAGGDPRSWAALQHVVRVIAQWNASKTSVIEPEDLEQELLGRMLADDCRAIRIFIGRPNRHLYRYIADSARNLIVDHARRVRSRSREIVEPVTHAEPDAELHVLTEQIEAKAQRLGTRSQRVRDAKFFRAYYRAGMSAQEIADHFGMNVKSVETALFRLTANLRKACNDTPDSESEAA